MNKITRAQLDSIVCLRLCFWRKQVSIDSVGTWHGKLFTVREREREQVEMPLKEAEHKEFGRSDGTLLESNLN